MLPDSVNTIIFDLDDTLVTYNRTTDKVLDEAFETVVFAGYDTEPKPAPEPCYRALSTLDSHAERVVNVGNSLASDVAGAHTAGLRSVWISAYDEDATVEPHSRLTSLAELAEPPWS